MPKRMNKFAVALTLASLHLASSCAVLPREAPLPASVVQEPLAVPDSLPPAIGELRQTFRVKYDAAAKEHASAMRAAYPLITQDLLNMTLHPTTGNPVRFAMEQNGYLLVSHIADAPMTVYTTVAIQGFGELTPTVEEDLTTYAGQLKQAVVDLNGLEIPPLLRADLVSILESTATLIGDAVATGSLTETQFASFVVPLRPRIRNALRAGARQQLVQYREQMNRWRAEYPYESWQELRVVVLGFNPARQDDTLLQFFQWLLREPDYERRVVLAEFPGPVSADNKLTDEAMALETLTRVDLDQAASMAVFGDPSVLQQDVMGPAAASILESWGPSDWP